MRWKTGVSSFLGNGMFLLGACLALVQPANVWGQKSRFQHYTVSEGLCHPFIYNLSQDKNGFIWIGTGEGLCRFDGVEFHPAADMDSLPVDVVNVCYTDKLGKLWFGFNNGQVWAYDGNYFVPYSFGTEINTSISGIAQSEEEGILVATQKEGIFKVETNETLVPFEPAFEHGLISTLFFGNGMLLVGSQEGLFEYQSGGRSDDFTAFPELNYIHVQVIKEAFNGNSYWVGTEDAGLYLLTIDSLTHSLVSVGADLGLQNENIQDIAFDADSNLMLASYNSGFLTLNLDPKNPVEILSMQRVNANNGLSTNFVKCLLTDRENNIWLGTYGSGISMQTSQSFAFYNFDEPGFASISALAEHDSLLWLGGANGILQLNTLSGSRHLLHNAGLPNDEVTSLFFQGETLWVGTQNNGVYSGKLKENRFTPFFQGNSTISNSINHITGDKDNLYIATKSGIYVVNLQTREQFHYSTLNGLPHNDIEYLYLDAENRLLFATRTNGIYQINVRGEVEEYFTVGKYELDFNSMVQDERGHIWVSTYGQGIFLLQPDSVINITAREGLKSNYCYSLLSDDSLYVWVGHRLGLSRIDRNNLSVSVFDADNGIVSDCNQNAAVISNSRELFFGTTDGLIGYNIAAGYQKKMAPLANILQVTISDKPYDFRKPIALPYDAYKLRIEYIGLNYSDPKAVRYQYKLEGYDLDWSEVTDLRTVIYPRIEDGEYTFRLRAIGPDGTFSEMPASFSLRVKLPIWKQWWFIALMLILAVLVVTFIIKFRERQQKELQEYLEKRLDERTREVVEQKEEIEVKNRDITDSINYAQRIQSSILPPIKRLQQHFDGSFIFFQPRDIVSGDFYWFDQVKGDKFVLVCADSTGHGVPGAFMSMIGTTLIKDVCMRPDVNSPSEIVRELDKELCNTLNQNADAEQSNDGMDLIVCELDVRTNYLRFCSAMRPLIVYKGGEQLYFKGSRDSVGGQYDKDQKSFKDEGVQLDKGDLIYLFSDGYPDQFGGSVGKKFKMARLKNLLRDINQKPMEEQYEYVKSTFNLWREDFEQVDDVLFMGVKL